MSLHCYQVKKLVKLYKRLNGSSSALIQDNQQSCIMTIKDHLENRLKLWYWVISEIKGIHNFQQQERMNDSFYRRLFVNNLFSILDTYIHVIKELVKIKTIIDNDDNNPISWTEMAVLHEKKVVLDSQGNVQVKDDFQELVSLLRFTLNIFARVFQADQPDDSDSQFEKLTYLASRKKEILHPQSPVVLNITDQEIKEAQTLLLWLMHTHDALNNPLSQWLKKMENEWK